MIRFLTAAALAATLIATPALAGKKTYVYAGTNCQTIAKAELLTLQDRFMRVQSGQVFLRRDLLAQIDHAKAAFASADPNDNGCRATNTS